MIKLEEVATRLGVTKRTIYDWVNKGILQPANEKSFVGASIVFNEKDVEKLKELLTKNISLHAAAIRVGVPYLFLKNWVREHGGDIKEEVKGKSTKYFLEVTYINEHQSEILEAYHISKGTKREKKDLGRELMLYANGYRLFDKIDQDGQSMLVMNTNPVELRTSLNTFNSSQRLNFTSSPCLNLPYSGYRGQCVCVMPKDESIDSPIYSALESLVYQFGTKNIRVFEGESSYTVLLRNGRIPNIGPVKEVLLQYVKEGEVYEDGETIVLGEYDRVSVPVHLSWLKRLNDTAEARNVSISQWISMQIERWMEEDNNKKTDKVNRIL
jgi:predicted DNA-binding transcriptional regulator AlpA